MDERSKWTTVAWAVGAGVLVLVALRVLAGGGGQAPPLSVDAGGPSPTPARGAPAGGARGSRTGEGLLVHVAGSVRQPGLHRLAPGSRVADALEAAGGPTERAELAAINLAAPVQDGQQVVVPRAGAQRSGAAAGLGAGAAGAGPSGVGSATGGAKLSLATATLEQLEALDGIGPALAGRILAFRDSHGGFRSLEQLGQVEGIGEKRLASLKQALAP